MEETVSWIRSLAQVSREACLPVHSEQPEDWGFGEGRDEEEDEIEV